MRTIGIRKNAPPARQSREKAVMMRKRVQLGYHFNVHEDVMNYHPNTSRLVCYNLVAKRITG